MKNFKKICLGAVSLAIILSGVSAFAYDDHQLTASFTEDFVNWQNLTDEEKQEKLVPRISTLNIPEKSVSEDLETNVGLRQQVLTGNFEKNSKIALTGNNGYQLSRYNLNDERNVNVKVKHQGNTNECWAFSMTSVLETNLALTKNIQKEFSPRHMDYSFVRTFIDGINQDNLNREAGMGGLSQFAIAYLTNGKGAVLESDMPFEDNYNKICLSDLNKRVDTIATDTVAFPEIYKIYSDNGSITYTNGGTDQSKVVYTEQEVNEFRNSIKNHIVNYGAISAVTAGNLTQYYSNPSNPIKSKAYFCNDSSAERDHAVTIVGWDDNYSRNNFTGAAKPSKDGAYICLNTYGTSNFDNGYLYISYEDVLIESYLYGIKSASTVDYDKIYQYNPTGENIAVGINGIQSGYIAEIFNRDASHEENLQYVGVNLPSDMYLSIYVNPTGDELSLDKCVLTKVTEKLSAGYHRIPIDSVNLYGDKFAIIIKETSVVPKFEFSIEVAVENSIFSTIQGNPGKSLYSDYGEDWKTLSSQRIVGLNMRTADMTIKAFTLNGHVEEGGGPDDTDIPDNPDNPSQTITSDKYTIKNRYIYKVSEKTTVENFKNNISTNLSDVIIYDGDRQINGTDFVKTGTKVKLSDDTIYTIIVRGDCSCDGRISLIDLSKIIAHYGDENQYGLKDDPLKAADLNFDGKVSLIDVSQIVNIVGNQID